MRSVFACGALALAFLVAATGLDPLRGGHAQAQSATAPASMAPNPIAKGPSGLPLPRYVSLKAKRVNLRVGPGRDYAVSWLYTRPGLPMEIIQEYDNWRRVRDAEGTEGWIYQSLLSGERTAVVAPWRRGKASDEVYIAMRESPDKSGSIVAKLEPGVIVRIGECNGTWCETSTDGAKGWIEQADLWGAYPGEAFK